MAENSYALLKDNVVKNTAIFDDPTEELLNHFKEVHSVDLIIECPPHVMPEYTWDGEDFIRPQPYPSWTFDPETKDWIPPVEYPKDELFYVWDESTLSWVAP